MGDIIKVWVTKYCLTQGILEIEVELVGNGMVRHENKNGMLAQYFHLPDWHKDKLSAIYQAENMRKKAIEQTNRKLNKLKSLVFL